MTAPTTTLLHAVDNDRVVYDHDDHAYLLDGRSLSDDEYQELIQLRTDMLVHFPVQPVGRFERLATTTVGKRVAAR